MSATALLVFARCAGFVFKAPGFSHPNVPAPLRAGLAFVLALGLRPGVVSIGRLFGAELVFAAAVEVALGAAIGTAAAVFYDGAYAAGRALDDYVGIRGSVPNAALFAASGFGRIWSLTFISGFFLLGGYGVVITVLADGFARLPPGALLHGASLARFAIALPSLILKAAVLIAGPAIVVVFVAQCALGSLSRVIPRFASFTLFFPVNFAGALIVTLITVPLLFYASGRPWLYLPFLRLKP